MITRSAKRKSMHFECNPLLQVPGNEVQIQSQSSISIEGSGYVPLDNKQFQRPIFNIHIHSPVHEISTIKISMPGSHPLIQVCPNKAVKTLEYNTGNGNRKRTSTLCDKELPFESISTERNCLELENSSSSQRCLTDIKNVSSKNSKCSYSSKKRTTDTSFKNNNNNNNNNNNSNSNNNSNNKTFKNSKEISSYAVDINSIKLNKAVVVLTDICKTKYYKAAFTDNAAKDQVNNSGIETKKDVRGIVVKQENLNGHTGIIDNCWTDTTDGTFNTRPSLKSVNTTSLNGSRLLTQLAEGCSFSEILNRFRMKNGNLVDTLNSADTVNHENFNTEGLEVYNNRVFKSERLSENEDEDTTEDFLTSEITEKIESMDFEDSNLLDLPQGLEYEKSRDVEHLRDQSLDSHMVSDHNKSTTAVQSVTEDVTADKETADSSSVISDVVSDSNVTIPKEICNIPETSNTHISKMNNSDLSLHESEQPNLEMEKEIMKGKKFLGINKSKSKKNKRSKSKSPKPRHSPSPKKMKLSSQKSDTSHGKTKLPDEYIPLQASGPTKFGVAMLHQIKPYVQHDAKDFRDKMLFGDRIKRVSSSQQMQIYKLKQKVNRSIRG